MNVLQIESSYLRKVRIDELYRVSPRQKMWYVHAKWIRSGGPLKPSAPERSSLHLMRQDKAGLVIKSRGTTIF